MTSRPVLAWIFAAGGVLITGSSLAGDWTLVPGLRAGPITGNTGEAELRTLFGEQNVAPSEIEIGEGLTEPGTVLFPMDPTRRAEILWVGQDRRKIRTLRITGKGTAWRTDRGVTIGTSLERLSQINRRPLTLSGFDFDYAGTIADCNGGVLKELGTQTDQGFEGRTLILRVSPDPGRRGTREYSSLKGDRVFQSDHPAMRRLNPTVYEITIRFGRD